MFPIFVYQPSKQWIYSALFCNYYYFSCIIQLKLTLKLQVFTFNFCLLWCLGTKFPEVVFHTWNKNGENQLQKIGENSIKQPFHYLFCLWLLPRKQVHINVMVRSMLRNVRSGRLGCGISWKVDINWILAQIDTDTILRIAKTQRAALLMRVWIKIHKICYDHRPPK